MNEPERISFGRLALGFAIPALALLGFYTYLLWPSWEVALVVGGGLGGALILLLGLPAFFLLRKRKMLSVYVAVALGGILCALPIAILGSLNFMGDAPPARIFADHAYFVLVYFFLPGCAGGLIGWLAAVGFRIRAS
jgi:hypothetical protein